MCVRVCVCVCVCVRVCVCVFMSMYLVACVLEMLYSPFPSLLSTLIFLILVGKDEASPTPSCCTLAIAVVR